MAARSARLGEDQARSTLELLYHISRELASDLDLQTVLRRVLLLSLESVGGASGSIIVLDASGKPVDSAIIHTGQMYDHATRQLSSTLEKGLAGWVMSHRQAVIIPDTSQDDRWFKRPDDAPDQTGPKSAMSTPLLARDELVGVLTLAHPIPGTFNEEHGALMRAIADQAGIKILNARLFEETQRRARVMTALAESAMSLTASLGMEDILQNVLAQVQKALDVEAVTLALIDSDRTTLTIRAATGPRAAEVVNTNFAIGKGIAGHVARSGETRIVTEIAKDDHFDVEIDGLSAMRPRAIACAPIRTEGEVIGTLEAVNPAEEDFDPEARLVLDGLGSLTGSVVHSARLFAELEAAHESYRQLFDDSIDLILITDWDGRIRQFNQRAAGVLRIPEKDLQDTVIFEIHRASEQYPEADLFARLEANETVSYESELMSAGGEIPVQVFVRQIRLKNESLLQWIIHDITERKAVDAQRDDLISMIYHDLRSPLANVIYSMEMLESMKDPTKETMTSFIDVAIRATERIQRLTSSLLDIKSLEAGQPLTNLEPVPVDEILDDSLKAIRPLAESKQQEIVSNPEANLADVMVDRDMINRVLINLLENAVKYTPRNGRITSGAKRSNGFVEFWVQDNGPGIPETEWQNIFNKYTRLDKRNLGFGLGLSFCRLAVEGHGGRIWIESPEGNGTRFVFSLPASEIIPAV